LDQQLVQAVLADWRTAPIDDRMRAALGFLEGLTLDPTHLTRDDIDALREAGISDDGIRNLITICALFSMMDRVADAMDFDLPSARGKGWRNWIANHIGYRFNLFG
jgi:uncharacterized peroxidase-related enzyme